MVMLKWMEASDVAWHYIAPGKPQQNAFIESFIGRLRDECLNEMLFSFSPPGRRITRRTTAFSARLPHTAGVPKLAHRLCRQPRQRSELQPRTLLMMEGYHPCAAAGVR
jgi:transposase InsO family protein